MRKEFDSDMSTEPVYYGGVEGPVVIPALAGISINPGDSVNYYFALSYGSTRQEMINNMAAAQSRYNVIVPVELTSFKAKTELNRVILEWTTASEINNRGFEIERKVGAESSWLMIGQKEGKGTTTEPQW